MSAWARTIPCLRLPTAASRSATASWAASSCASTCKCERGRIRDDRERAVPAGAAQGSRQAEPIRGRGAAPSPFFHSPSHRCRRTVTQYGPQGRRIAAEGRRCSREPKDCCCGPAGPRTRPPCSAAIADETIVRNLASAPWPYALADAEAFLATERDPAAAELPDLPPHAAARRGWSAAIGIGPRPDGALELGYWIARPYWGLGFATEAARAVIAIARDALRLERLVRRPLPRQSGVGPGAGEARLPHRRAASPSASAPGAASEARVPCCSSCDLGEARGESRDMPRPPVAAAPRSESIAA